jgi:hypothetical protein
MCQPANCPACAKTTWSGCGNHVDQVKAKVPAGQWCSCTDAQKQAAKGPSIMQRIFSR